MPEKLRKLSENFVNLFWESNIYQNVDRIANLVTDCPSVRF